MKAGFDFHEEAIFSDEGHTTLQALAEVIQGDLSRKTTDAPLHDFEDILEMVRNAYLFVVWFNERNDRSAGNRASFQSLLKRERYVVDKDTLEINIGNISVVDLPRDEGIAAVIPVNDKGFYIDTLIKSSSATILRPQEIKTKGKYIRIEDVIQFPVGLPPCTKEVEVVYLGMKANSSQGIKVSRQYASMVYDRIMGQKQPTRGNTADITPNQNPND